MTVSSEDVPLEVLILQQVRDIPGVATIQDWHETRDSFYIVMERCSGQDLFDYISMQGTLTEQVSRTVFRQILEGVSQCHQVGVLHGDIKDENVMIEPSTGAVTLIDFGSSLLLHTGDYTEFYGTREYSPPEWLTDRRFRAENLTVWSLGILLYNMLVGDIPFLSDEDILEKELSWPESVSPCARVLVSGCLRKEELERFSLQQVRDHPWLEEAHTPTPAPAPVMRRNKKFTNLVLLTH